MFLFPDSKWEIEHINGRVRMNIALIVAGGVGNRFGANRPKQFVEVMVSLFYYLLYLCFSNHPM